MDISFDKPKFTPGRWYIDNGIFICSRNKQKGLFSDSEYVIISVGCEVKSGDAKANMRLMAASKRMYNILIGLKDKVDEKDRKMIEKILKDATYGD